MKRLLTLIFLLGTVLSVSATSVYLTKSQAGNDAVSAYRYAHSHEGDPKWQGILDIYADSVMVPNGESIALTDTLTYAGSLPGREGDGFSQYIIGANYAPGSTRFIIADWQGQSLAFDVHDLQFSEEKSDKGAKNYLYQFEDHRSLNQRFWDTMIPCTIIFILLILSVLCIAVADWLDVPEFSKIMLIVSGVLTLIVAIFELEGFFTVHDNIFWWISISKVGLESPPRSHPLAPCGAHAVRRRVVFQQSHDLAIRFGRQTRFCCSAPQNDGLHPRWYVHFRDYQRHDAPLVLA